jgi:ribose/xylose/arabinose/galactoside ABC-type transport system permease subunit
MTSDVRSQPAAAAVEAAGQPGSRSGRAPRQWWTQVHPWDGMPFYLMVALLIVVSVKEPGALSYDGLDLLLSSAVPLALAAISQLFIMAAGDIDLGIGSFIGLVNVLTAVYLGSDPGLGLLAYVGLVAGYVVMGVLVHYRRLPAIVVTLGASFMWLGAALLILPTPGGTVPSGIVTAFNGDLPLVPTPIVELVVIAAVSYLFLIRTRYGTVLRGAGSNGDAVERVGWSLVGAKATLYGLAGVFGVLAGLALSSDTTSGDPNSATSYVLLSIAAVIIGGGEFSGGEVRPVGAVAAAVALSLVTLVLTFLGVSSNYQIGVEGLILVAALAARGVRSGLSWREVLA